MYFVDGVQPTSPQPRFAGIVGSRFSQIPGLTVLSVCKLPSIPAIALTVQPAASKYDTLIVALFCISAMLRYRLPLIHSLIAPVSQRQRESHACVEALELIET